MSDSKFCEGRAGRCASRLHRDGRSGFTLTEILVVLVIMSVMTAATGPALQALTGAGSVTKAILDTSQMYATARTYAMAHNTYVRVGLCEVTGSEFSTAITAVYSASGDSADAMDGVDGLKNWPMVVKPLVIRNFKNYNDLDASGIDTTSDPTPSASTVGSFSRMVPTLGSRTFGSVVQFNPAGEARILADQPTRYIKIGWDQPQSAGTLATRRNQNPFMLRLHGINGSVKIFRKEEL